MAARSIPVPSVPRRSLQPPRLPVYRPRRPHTQETIEQLSLSELRRRVRQNRVSFPSQVPIFVKHDRPDVQRKAVQLYFLFGWSCNRIAQRHELPRQRVQQILSTWKRRAVQIGYIQEIPPVALLKALEMLPLASS